MRELRTDKLTKLTAFRGTVTRTSDVRPELQYGAFKCLDCNTIVHGVEQQFKFSPPPCCTNNTCNNRCAGMPSCGRFHASKRKGTAGSWHVCFTCTLGYSTYILARLPLSKADNSPECRNNWTLVREQSIFCDWQRLKVQESVEEVRMHRS